MADSINPHEVRPVARTLHDIARVLESVEEPDKRIQRALELLHGIVPYDRCALLLAQDGGRHQLAVLPQAAPQDWAALDAMLSERLRALSEAGPQVASALGGDGSDGLRHLHVTAPLVGLGRVLGVLFVGRAAGNAYEEEDLALLSVVASQMASFFALLEARRQEVRRLQEVDALLATPEFAVVMLGADGRVASWNAGAEGILGYGAQDVLGQHFSVFYADEDVRADRPRQALALAQAHGRYEAEGWRVRHDGSQFWSNSVVTALCDKDGRVHGFSLLMRDDTQHRLADEALRYSQQQLSSIVDTAMDAIVAMDDSEHIVVFNRTAERIFRCSAAEAQGELVERFIPERFRKSHSEHVRRFRQEQAAGKAPSATAPLVSYGLRADGEEFPIEATISAARTDGHWMCTIILRDITERVRMEESLRQSEERFRLLAQNARDVIFLRRLLPTPAYEYVSPAATAVTGYAPEEWYADPDIATRIAHPGDQPRMEALKQSPDSAVEPIVWRCVHKDGHQYWLESQLVLVRDQAGQLVAVQGVARDISERKWTEDRLRLQLAAMESAANGIVITDTHGNITWANPAFTKLTGYTLDEVLGRNPRVLKSGVHGPDFYSNLWTAVLSGKVWQGEVVNLRKDGSLYHEEMTITPVRDSRGETTSFIAIKQDVTARVEAEKAVDRERRVTKAIMENTEAHLAYLDRDFKFVAVNGTYAAGAGRSVEDLIGKDHFEFFPNDENRAIFQRVRDTGQATRFRDKPFEFQGQAERGVTYWDWTLAPVEDASGAVQGLVLSLMETTRRVRAEQERVRLLERAETERRRLEVVLEASPAAIFVMDAASERLVLVNSEGRRMMGWAPKAEYAMDEFVNAAVRRRPDGSIYRPEALPPVRALRNGERVFLEEVLLEFPDGRTATRLVSAAPLYSGDGRPSGAVAIVQDMGPLEEAERRRSEFLGMVSHELRTPLTAIKGAAATALSSQAVDYAEGQQLFRIIDQQADKLRDLVNNLLDLTRIEAGTLSVNPGPTDLRGVVQEALAMFSRSGQPQEVQVRMPEGLPKVQADGRRTVQVLTNLLGNAAKFSPPSLPIVVDVEHDESHVAVHVRDRGRGIPAESLPKLFRKFSQVDEASDRGLGGTGLGLAICKGIVEAHGGRIWAESEGEGQGSTFSFTMPIAPGVVLATPTDTSRRAEHLGKVSRTAQKTRVLSVDDDPQALRYIRRTLDEAGYQALVTAEPAQCVELVREEEPDIVLLDLVLPGVSGFDLLQQIREFSSVPVIFLTGNDQGENAVRALKTGADDYITKPFAPSELLARIEVVLRRRLMSHAVEVRPPFALKDLTINFAERSVTKAGKPVALSATEYKLLYQLAVHAGQVLTHDQLLEEVWGPEYKGEAELLRSMMRNLRRSLGDDARQPRYILTEPQVGYRIANP